LVRCARNDGIGRARNDGIGRERNNGIGREQNDDIGRERTARNQRRARPMAQPQD
jgi:hypothetical protein